VGPTGWSLIFRRPQELPRAIFPLLVNPQPLIRYVTGGFELQGGCSSGYPLATISFLFPGWELNYFSHGSFGGRFFRLWLLWKYLICELWPPLGPLWKLDRPGLFFWGGWLVPAGSFGLNSFHPVFFTSVPFICCFQRVPSMSSLYQDLKWVFFFPKS